MWVRGRNKRNAVKRSCIKKQFVSERNNTRSVQSFYSSITFSWLPLSPSPSPVLVPFSGKWTTLPYSMSYELRFPFNYYITDRHSKVATQSQIQRLQIISDTQRLIVSLAKALIKHNLSSECLKGICELIPIFPSTNTTMNLGTKAFLHPQEFIFSET